MAIDFTELFTRQGRVAGFGYAINGVQALFPDMLSGVWERFENTADLPLIGPFTPNETQMTTTVMTPMASLSGLSRSTLLKMVADGSPTALGNSPQQALTELILRMRENSLTVKACNPSVTPTVLATNLGNGVLVKATKRGDGLVNENIVAELLRLGCSADSYTGGATEGQEQFVIQGAPLTTGPFDHNWPNGSGAQQSLNAVSADQDASSSGNLLTNGDCEDWSGSPLAMDNWAITGGTWGTDVLRGTNPNRGTYAMEFVNNTGTTEVVYQEFNIATGTTPALVPLTNYFVNFFAKKVSGTITGGILNVALVDSAGTTINDEQGIANSFNVICSTLTTSYVAKNEQFRIPEVLPADGIVRLRFRMATALTGARFTIDDICFKSGVFAYPGGFPFAVFSGATPFAQNDGWNIQTANDQGGGSYGASFQTYFDRVFNMRGLNYLLPSSATPTYPNSLISFPGIVGYYRFETNVNDSSGNDNDLTPSSALYGTGKIGDGLTQGQGARTGFTGLQGLALDQNVSISGWAFVPALGPGNLGEVAYAQWTTGSWGVVVGTSDDSVGYSITVPGRVGVDGELAVNAWCHFVWTWDGTNSTVYVNGVLFDQQPATPTTANYNGAFAAVADSLATGGILDELMIFNGVLTAAQVAVLYASGAAFDPTNT